MSINLKPFRAYMHIQGIAQQQTGSANILAEDFDLPEDPMVM